jgi:hypothetical protein
MDRLSLTRFAAHWRIYASITMTTPTAPSCCCLGATAVGAAKLRQGKMGLLLTAMLPTTGPFLGSGSLLRTLQQPCARQQGDCNVAFWGGMWRGAAAPESTVSRAKPWPLQLPCARQAGLLCNNKQVLQYQCRSLAPQQYTRRHRRNAPWPSTPTTARRSYGCCNC